MFRIRGSGRKSLFFAALALAVATLAGCGGMNPTGEAATDGKREVNAAASGTTIAALTGWVSGTNNPKVAGTDRLMVVMVTGEHSATNSVTQVTYGGQVMTKQVENCVGTGTTTYSSIFTLDEAGVSAATSGTIAVTWKATPSSGSSVVSVLLGNVDQATPVPVKTQTSLPNGTTLSTSSFSTTVDHMLIMSGATANNNTQTFNNSFIKMFEGNAGWGDGVAGYKMGTGVSETPSFSQSASGRMSLCAVLVKSSYTTPTYYLQVYSGHGGVEFNPPGSNFVPGTVVTLTVYPHPGYRFTGWSGSVTGTSNSITVTMDGDKTVYANYVELPVYYTLNLSTTGQGTVSANPVGPTYLKGTFVTVTATPESGCTLLGWDGNTSATPNSSINLLMDSDFSITANFSSLSTPDAVSILGYWTVGANHIKEPGWSRALVVFVYGEHKAAMSVNSVTYGGQAMTPVVSKSQGTTTNSYVGAFILKEAGVAAATSDAIAVSWAAAPSAGYSISSVFLTNVDQATPCVATTSNGTNSALTIAASALTNSSGNLILVGAVGGNNGAYTINNGFTRGFAEQALSWGDMTGAWKAATGAMETPSVTMSSSMRQAITGLVIKTAAPQHFTITASSGPDATITPSGTITVDGGANQSYTATNVIGEAVWTVDDVEYWGHGYTWSFTTISASHTISVKGVSGGG